MKVLIVITQGKIGGASNSVFLLAKGLKKKGIKVKVGFGEGDYLKEKLKKEKIPFVNFKWLKRTHNPLFNLLFIFEIKKFLEKEPFDVCHFNSTNALFGALGAKISKGRPKTIFTVRGLSILDPHYRKNFFLKIIYWLVFRFLFLFVNHIVFVSKQNLKDAQKIKLTNKGIVIYNGILEPQFLEREVARKFFEEKLNIDLEEKFLIGSIGRLDYSKNYDFLIKVFSEILKIKENAVGLIIGNGPERKKLERLIEKLNLKEKFFLFQEIPEASQYLKAFDLFVLPSRYEGLSLSLIETLFAQVPTIASNVGGNKEIIGNEFVFSFNNKESFLKIFQKALNSKFEFQKRKFFSFGRCLKEYLKLYFQ
mgnify:CR=1 FL=1